MYVVKILVNSKILKIKEYVVLILILKRKSLSTLQLFNEVIAFFKCVKKVKPDIIHLISMRPAIVGLLTSIPFKKIKVFITFTGLGFIFIRKSFKSKILNFLLKFFL